MSAAALTSNGETFCHTSYIPLENAQVSPNTYFELATGMDAIIPSSECLSNDGSLDSGVTVHPYLEISVQPCDRFRFRYKSESGSHGKLRGPAKNRSKTNFPTVQVHNWFDSHDEIEIRASLYTFEENPKPHILELVGKNCRNGDCYEKLSDDNTAIFRFLEIESKRKEEAIGILIQKEKDLFGNICDEEELRKQVIEDIKKMDMNCAILCFEAFLGNVPICEQVFSGPIKNLKSTTSDLKITRISSSSGSCRGGDDVILLCDKINRDDIEIRFYAKDNNDEILFEANGSFNPKVDVHHQVAIAFKTPAYRDNIGATVQMELYRKSDKQSSEPRQFTYIPDDIDALRHSKKRKFNVEWQNQASCSSEFLSSPSGSSGLDDISAFQGSPGTSSNDNDISDDIDEMLRSSSGSLDQLLTNFLVDIDNFDRNLENSQGITVPSTSEDYNNVEMEAATLCSFPSGTQEKELDNWDGYYNDVPIDTGMGIKANVLDLYPSEPDEEEEESDDWDEYYADELSDTNVFAPQSATYHRNQGTAVVTSSSDGGILSYFGDLHKKALRRRGQRSAPSIGEAITDSAILFSTGLWNSTIGRAVSYMKPSDPIAASGKHVEESVMADVGGKTLQYQNIQAQCLIPEFVAEGQMRKHRAKPSPQYQNIQAQCLTPEFVAAGQMRKHRAKPSHQYQKRQAQSLTEKCIAVGQMGKPRTRPPQYEEEQIFAQSALIFSMEDLSIEEENEKVVKKPFVSLPVGNMERPSGVEYQSPFLKAHKTVVADGNSYDVYTSNIGDANKTSETTKSFDSFKEGVSTIMKRRKNDVYINYISRLMSVKDENENLFIHLAVLEQSENLNLMARILKMSPHIVNKQNKFLETPIHLAAQKNAWKMALLLLAHEGNPSIVDINGNNCFHIASQSNFSKCMKVLLFSNLKKEKNMLSIDGFNYDGFSPLHLSVMNNAKECMQLLLKAGADVNINDRKSGSSPMHLAIKQQPSLAAYLLSHPDVDLLNTDFNGSSVIHALCVMKGIPMPSMDMSTDLVNWAHKALTLPSKDSDESSGSSTSSNSDSDEEVANQNEAEATSSFSSYTGNIQSQTLYVPEDESNSLSAECEERLCKSLDADGSWRKLGIFVGFDEKTLNGVSKLCKNSSPSKLVLKKVKKLYQKCDKTTLINILAAADLKNKAEILRK